jgi:hypothetical protein
LFGGSLLKHELIGRIGSPFCLGKGPFPGICQEDKLLFTNGNIEAVSWDL